jgi:hypothetical protein
MGSVRASDTTPEPTAEEPAVQVAPVGVPPLLVGSFYRYQTLFGGMVAHGWQGPIAVMPSLLVPARNYFDKIRDRAPLPQLPEALDPPDRQARIELEMKIGEVLAYCDAIDKAYMFKATQFAAALEAKQPTWKQLINNPRRNRGAVMQIKGNLRRLERFDPPLMVQANGVRDLYEGWIFQDDSNDPWCVIFPDLPEGLEPADKMNQPVTFDGYFFKVLGYRNEMKQDVFAPLLIGNSPVVEGPLRAGGDDPMMHWSRALLYGIFSIVLTVMILATALTWWFRRGDARVRGKLSEIAHRQFVDPSTIDDLPEPPPAGYRAPLPPDGLN